MEGKLNGNYTREIRHRSRGQNELIGNFKMGAGYGTSSLATLWWHLSKTSDAVFAMCSHTFNLF